MSDESFEERYKTHCKFIKDVESELKKILKEPKTKLCNNSVFEAMKRNRTEFESVFESELIPKKHKIFIEIAQDVLEEDFPNLDEYEMLLLQSIPCTDEIDNLLKEMKREQIEIKVAEARENFEDEEMFTVRFDRLFDKLICLIKTKIDERF